MPTYETTKFLSLPQQVNKNKKDIEVLQQNQADISNLIPKTEKGQALGVATLDINGLVPPGQLPPNPGDFLERSGGRMEGDIDMDTNDIQRVNSISASYVITETLDSASNAGKIEVFVPLDMKSNKIVNAAKGTAAGDVATVENINDHNVSPFAHADIRNLISAMQGAYIYRGVINENTINVTQISLTNRLNALMSRAPILGDVLTDLDRTDWYFDGASWDNMGQTFVVLASAVNDGLMSKEDYTKLFDLYNKVQLDATFEALANKAIDFSTVNDTKYPTTKAVSTELDKKIDKRYITNLVTNGDFATDLLNWETNSATFVSGRVYINSNIGGSGYISQLVSGLKTDIFYYRFNLEIITGSLRVNFPDNQNIIYSTSGVKSGPIQPTVDNASIIFIRSSSTITNQFYLDNIHVFNLTELFGVTATSGTAYNSAVAEIEAELLANNGYIDGTKELNIYNVASTKANIVQEAWLTPTLTGATSTYIRYRKDTLGTVIVEGNITVTTAGTNLTLPVGYRPLFAYTVGILTFNTNGTVVSSATGTQTLSVRYTGA